jgi:hypothetical protein
LKKGNFGLDPKIFSQRAPVRELRKTINHQLIQQRALLKCKVRTSLPEASYMPTVPDAITVDTKHPDPYPY